MTISYIFFGRNDADDTPALSDRAPFAALAGHYQAMSWYRVVDGGFRPAPVMLMQNR